MVDQLLMSLLPPALSCKEVTRGFVLSKQRQKERAAAGEGGTREKQQYRVCRELGKDTGVLFLEICDRRCLIDQL